MKRVFDYNHIPFFAVVGSLLLSQHPRMLVNALIVDLDVHVFYNGVMDGFFDVIVDVRSQREFDAGHIRGATLVEQLALYGTSLQVTTPDDLVGCEYCHVAVYDRSGGRSAVVVQLLQKAGFVHLYNALGTNQWTWAGYELETGTPSVAPPCTVDRTICAVVTSSPTGAPTAGPAAAPFATTLAPTPGRQPPPPTDLFLVEPQVFQLNMVQFHNIYQAGLFQVVVDVRSRAEFEEGHIPGATLVEDLASYDGTSSPTQTGMPAALKGCEYCMVAVYDSSGHRARLAMQNLVDAGFLYVFHGQGTLQWKAYGYKALETGGHSVEPPCTTQSDVGAACQAHVQVKRKAEALAPPTSHPKGVVLRP